MDAQTLGALATIVNEAIAKAAGPLQAKVTELEKSLSDTLDHLVSAAEARTKMLDVSVSLTDRVKALEGRPIPDAYDDAGLIDRVAKQLEALREEIPAKYDDTEIKGAVAETEKRLATAHAVEVEAVLNRIKDARYDDTKLRGEVADGLKLQTDAMEGLLGKIKHLEARPEPTAPLDGRDALHLEVLPAIDEQKSYQRGTYAKHAGGLWRSFEQTSGLRGWECIVNGVKSVDARWDGKTLIETTTLSDGTVSEARKFFPVAVYKGVFDGGEYVEGDTTTWAGSLWNCNVTATKAKPGDGSTDWTLAVKKGRDGKEVVNVPRGEPQPVAIAGWREGDR